MTDEEFTAWSQAWNAYLRSEDAHTALHEAAHALVSQLEGLVPLVAEYVADDAEVAGRMIDWEPTRWRKFKKRRSYRSARVLLAGEVAEAFIATHLGPEGADARQRVVREGRWHSSTDRDQAMEIFRKGLGVTAESESTFKDEARLVRAYRRQTMKVALMLGTNLPKLFQLAHLLVRQRRIDARTIREVMQSDCVYQPPGADQAATA
ncbi:MAG: hypothetical protein MUF10_10785 [Thermoanaerobaculaceae bacterium]|jgi:ATP-dependent Zn protease|nr:hypothetical protein [Thermoanaerobaculaceae bacterium]